MKDKDYYYIFNGSFSNYCKKFIDYKRSLGFKICEPYCHRLWDMDNLFSLHLPGQNKLSITKDMAEAYVSLRGNESTKTQHLRMSTIRQFALFMNRIGFDFYVYPKTAFVGIKEDFIPYILTHDEISRLADILDHIPYSARYPRCHLIYPMLFRLLYGCGLRLNEALSLKICDMDMEKGIIVLSNTKNQGQRLIPMSVSIHRYCRHYISKMNFGNKYESCLFPSDYKDSLYRERLGGGTAYQRLRQFMKKASIHKEDGRIPRVHDLRHTFAVHSLEKMVSEGRDIYCALPTLSTYLGHRGIESTEKYLRLTQESFRSIISGMESYYGDLFPEVCHDET